MRWPADFAPRLGVPRRTGCAPAAVPQNARPDGPCGCPPTPARWHAPAAVAPPCAASRKRSISALGASPPRTAGVSCASRSSSFGPCRARQRARTTLPERSVARDFPAVAGRAMAGEVRGESEKKREPRFPRSPVVRHAQLSPRSLRGMRRETPVAVPNKPSNVGRAAARALRTADCELKPPRPLPRPDLRFHAARGGSNRCRRTDTTPDYTRRNLPRRTRAVVHHGTNQSRAEVRDDLVSNESGAASSGSGRIPHPRLGSAGGSRAAHVPDAVLREPEHST
jgi:hypothetical protein